MKEYFYKGNTIEINGYTLKQNSIQLLNLEIKYKAITVNKSSLRDNLHPNREYISPEGDIYYIITNTEKKKYYDADPNALFPCTGTYITSDPNLTRYYLSGVNKILSIFNLNNNGNQCYIDNDKININDFIEINFNYKNIITKKYVMDKRLNNFIYNTTDIYNLYFEHNYFYFVNIADHTSDPLILNNFNSYQPQRDIHGLVLNEYQKLYKAKFVTKSRIDGKNIFELLD